MQLKQIETNVTTVKAKLLDGIERKLNLIFKSSSFQVKYSFVTVNRTKRDIGISLRQKREHFTSQMEFSVILDMFKNRLKFIWNWTWDMCF